MSRIPNTGHYLGQTLRLIIKKNLKYCFSGPTPEDELVEISSSSEIEIGEAETQTTPPANHHHQRHLHLLTSDLLLGAAGGGGIGIGGDGHSDSETHSPVTEMTLMGSRGDYRLLTVAAEEQEERQERSDDSDSELSSDSGESGEQQLLGGEGAEKMVSGKFLLNVLSTN